MTEVYCVEAVAREHRLAEFSRELASTQVSEYLRQRKEGLSTRLAQLLAQARQNLGRHGLRLPTCERTTSRAEFQRGHDVTGFFAVDVGVRWGASWLVASTSCEPSDG